ncbi:hypothetical protein HRF59_04800 [Bacillus velezensis]|uniref:DUF5677 domain-containing protein n=1 Tax=Bacillus amyloliquefaciens group TaxID=1938374 RepID=UPI001404CE5F|nr:MULTISPECIES: DUF5677 domain-containing protein [Bacillus amyloliquefaciens group]MCA1233319.1 DUF5677 domain-containing protein [Bacillus velezensis]MCA1311419.1 DUF5677 domain-containing protein [Bacillus velezensis]MCA1330344.1 DUF5677 domain-containing protein [Bacillus velezensis]NHN20935.1 hypothetical protein [Bacillus amyloliquefaciens]NMP63660.1 hypothetical protein [Bacillus velezensis]
MDFYQKMFNEILEGVTKTKQDIKCDEINKLSKEIIDKIIDPEGDIFLDAYNNLKNKMHSNFMYEELTYQEPHTRLKLRWLEGFVLLKAVEKICEEVSINFLDDLHFNPPEDKKLEFVLQVLMKIHVRSISISKEIQTLLMAGFADAALSRWRSLHENSVIFKVLMSNFKDLEFTNELVDRFINYSEIERYKELIIYKRSQQKLELEPIDIETEQEVKDKKTELIKKYGADFVKPNMWASILFDYKTKEIKFYQLEQLAGLDKLNAYYNQANMQVHVSPKGLYSSFSIIDADLQRELFAYGGSNYGLSLPGQLTAISLSQITIELLKLKPSVDGNMIGQLLNRLVGDCNDMFASIQEKIEDEHNESFEKSKVNN